MTNKTEMEQFAEAFCMHIRGAVRECDCGRVFWDSHNDGYDWDEGAPECHRNNPKATAVPYGVECLEIHGRICCKDCDCWHEKAERTICWMRSYHGQIAEWFRLEKLRLQSMAADVPAIEPPTSGVASGA